MSMSFRETYTNNSFNPFAWRRYWEHCKVERPDMWDQADGALSSEHSKIFDAAMRYAHNCEKSLIPYLSDSSLDELNLEIALALEPDNLWEYWLSRALDYGDVLYWVQADTQPFFLKTIHNFSNLSSMPPKPETDLPNQIFMLSTNTYLSWTLTYIDLERNHPTIEQYQKSQA